MPLPFGLHCSISPLGFHRLLERQISPPIVAKAKNISHASSPTDHAPRNKPLPRPCPSRPRVPKDGRCSRSNTRSSFGTPERHPLSVPRRMSSARRFPFILHAFPPKKISRFSRKKSCFFLVNTCFSAKKSVYLQCHPIIHAAFPSGDRTRQKRSLTYWFTKRIG